MSLITGSDPHEEGSTPADDARPRPAQAMSRQEHLVQDFVARYGHSSRGRHPTQGHHHAAPVPAAVPDVAGQRPQTRLNRCGHRPRTVLGRHCYRDERTASQTRRQRRAVERAVGRRTAPDAGRVRRIAVRLLPNSTARGSAARATRRWSTVARTCSGKPSGRTAAPGVAVGGPKPL
jgi:hypothetical protein